MGRVAQVKEIQSGRQTLYVVGTAPLLMHRWAAKALYDMLRKMMGGASTGREKREPELDVVRAVHLMRDDRFGFPASGFKATMVRAAKNTKMISMRDATGAFFIPGETVATAVMTEQLVEIVGAPVLDMRPARNDNRSADIRFRPLFPVWAAKLTIEYNANQVTPEQLGQLIHAGGFGVGIGDMRPEKGGAYGRFRLAEGAEEFAAIHKATAADTAAWFAANRELIQRREGEERRLLDFILGTPGAAELAQGIIRERHDRAGRPARGRRAATALNKTVEDRANGEA